MGLRTLGVLAGGDLPAHVLLPWVDSAEVVYVADAAADRLASVGCAHTLVGDLDSVTKAGVGRASRVVHDRDPHRTDVDKLLGLASDEGTTSITLAGLEGDRLDHMLATLGSVVGSRLDVRLVLRTGLAWLVRPGVTLELPAPVGSTVSLIPLVPCAGVHLGGVQWPLDGAALALGSLLSVSNAAIGSVVARLEEGTALLVWLRDDPEVPIWSP